MTKKLRILTKKDGGTYKARGGVKIKGGMPKRKQQKYNQAEVGRPSRTFVEPSVRIGDVKLAGANTELGSLARRLPKSNKFTGMHGKYGRVMEPRFGGPQLGLLERTRIHKQSRIGNKVDHFTKKSKITAQPRMLPRGAGYAFTSNSMNKTLRVYS